MACNSVATSKATISSVLYQSSELAAMLAKLLKVDVQSIYTYQSDYSDYRDANAYIGGVDYRISQQTINDVLSIRLDISGNNQAQSDQLMAQLQPDYDRALVVAQQTNVLKRLQQIGKLSNVQQKQSGVTARLEITI